MFVIGIVVFVLALPAFALNITGTNGNDILRGTAAADRINGKGGDDRILGRAGADILTGGSGADYVDGGQGADRLLLRDGMRDTAVCRAGRDTVLADQEDKVRADCENVQRPAQPSPPTPPAPPAPPPPPPVTVTPGSYKGLLEGNFIFFDVLPNRTLTGFRTNHIRETCNVVGWVIDWPLALLDSYPIRTDGSFQASGSGDTFVGTEPAKYVLELAGKFSGTTATGTILMSHEWDQEGSHWMCTSGHLPWTAALVP